MERIGTITRKSIFKEEIRPMVDEKTINSQILGINKLKSFKSLIYLNILAICLEKNGNSMKVINAPV